MIATSVAPVKNLTTRDGHQFVLTANAANGQDSPTAAVQSSNVESRVQVAAVISPQLTAYTTAFSRLFTTRTGDDQPVTFEPDDYPVV